MSPYTSTDPLVLPPIDPSLAAGPAAGSDVTMDEIQCLYKTKDPDAAFPLGDGQDPMNNKFASWALKHRDGVVRPIPCTVRRLVRREKGREKTIAYQP